MKVQGNLTVTGKALTVAVQEIDGSPTVLHVDTLKFSNGSVTNNGDGSVTITTSAGAVGISTVDDGTSTYSSQTAMGFSGDNFYLSHGTSGKSVLNLKASVGGGVTDHGALTGLTDDDHPQYSLVDGTRAFTGVIGGVTPTSASHLATKSYIDATVGPGFYGIFIRESDGNPPPYKNDTLIFDSGSFYLNSNSVGKPMVSLRANAIVVHSGLSGLTADDHPQYSLVDGTRAFTGTIGGVTPTNASHLATKGYVDTTIGPGFYGIILRESDGNPPLFRNDTMIFDSDYFYLQGNSIGKPIISLRPPATSNPGVTAHSALTGLLNDDHTQYSLVIGTRAFTGTIGGITPVAASDLATKGYVDSKNGTSFYGIFIRESDGNPPTYRNDTIIFDSANFYLNSNSVGKPMISLRPPTSGGISTLKDGASTYSSQTELNFNNKDFYLSHGGSAGAAVLNLTNSIDVFSFSMESVTTTNQYLEAFVPYQMRINTLSIICKAGSCVGGFYIVSSGNNKNGISITGFDPINITTTKQILTPTANNTLNEGDALLFSIASSSAAKNLRFTLLGRKV